MSMILGIGISTRSPYIAAMMVFFVVTAGLPSRQANSVASSGVSFHSSGMRGLMDRCASFSASFSSVRR